MGSRSSISSTVWCSCARTGREGRQVRSTGSGVKGLSCVPVLNRARESQPFNALDILTALEVAALNSYAAGVSNRCSRRRCFSPCSLLGPESWNRKYADDGEGRVRGLRETVVAVAVLPKPRTDQKRLRQSAHVLYYCDVITHQNVERTPFYSSSYFRNHNLGRACRPFPRSVKHAIADAMSILRNATAPHLSIIMACPLASILVSCSEFPSHRLPQGSQHPVCQLDHL